MTRGAMYAMALSQSAPMPYEKFSELEVAALERALYLSWGEAKAVQSDYEVNFDTSTEEEISEVLFEVMSVLANRRKGPLGKLIDYFDVPIAEATLRSFADPAPPASTSPGNKLSKRKPDFAFRRKRTPEGVNRSYCAAFVEAKLIERRKGMSWYVKTGIKRFTNGAYASSMSQGMMLGYVRGKTSLTLPASLNSYLLKKVIKADCNVQRQAIACEFSSHTPQMHASLHGRQWTYEGTGHSPGIIQVFHLWLNV